MTMLKGFIAGAEGVALFHQLTLALLSLAGVVQRAPFAMDPTRPFTVPAFLSLAFWGGIWGVIFVLTLAPSALMVNAAWGLGTALILRLLRVPWPAISRA